MRTVFADDSEISNAKNLHRTGLHHLVAMSAVVFTGDGLNRYATAIRQLRAELGVPDDCELKWSPPAGSWLKTPEGNAVRTALRRGMLTAATNCGARSVTVIYDRISSEAIEVVKGRVLRYLYDKLSMHLIYSGGHAVMIADEPGGGAEDRKAWLAGSRQLTDHGTAYTSADRIGIPIITSPSDHLEHLQLADLVAGATTGAVAGNRFALELGGDLAGLADRNRAGRIGGAGVTIWPPRHMDLYWWLYGETVYQRKGYRMQLGPGSRPMPWRTFQSTPGM